MPIVRRRVPLLDVLRRGVSSPDLGNRGRDEGFNADFHEWAPVTSTKTRIVDLLLESATSAGYRNDERSFPKSTSSRNFFCGGSALPDKYRMAHSRSRS